MANFRAVWTADISDAADPEAAAREALRRILDSHDGGCHVFLVEDKGTGRRFTVDLGTEDWRDGEPLICEIEPAH